MTPNISLPTNLRAPAFRLTLAAVYVWGMGVGISGLGTLSPVWPVASFVVVAAAIAFGVVAQVPDTARAAAFFAIAPAAALVVPFEHERLAATKLTTFDFVAIAVALSIYFATALSYRGRQQEAGTVVLSPLDAELPLDAHRAIRGVFYALVAATTAAFLFGPGFVVPRTGVEAAWGDAANEAEVLSALANGAVAMTWAGVLLRHAVRKPAASERLPTALRKRRWLAASAIGAVLLVAAFFLRG